MVFAGAFDDDPFVIGEHDGIIRTNAYFQENQEGNIQFVIKVNDSLPQHFDKANVSVRENTCDIMTSANSS